MRRSVERAKNFSVRLLTSFGVGASLQPCIGSPEPRDPQRPGDRPRQGDGGQTQFLQQISVHKGWNQSSASCSRPAATVLGERTRLTRSWLTCLEVSPAHHLRLQRASTTRSGRAHVWFQLPDAVRGTPRSSCGMRIGRATIVMQPRRAGVSISRSQTGSGSHSHSHSALFGTFARSCC